MEYRKLVEEAIALARNAEDPNFSPKFVLYSSLATRRRTIVAKIGDPVSVFSNRDIQLLCHVVNESRKEVDILDKDIGILHSNNPCALEFTLFQIKMKLTTTLVLALILPINIHASLHRKRDRNNGTLAKRLRLQTINDIGDLLFHALSIVTLSTSSFGQLPLIIFFLSIVPAHILLCVIVQSPCRKKLRLDERSLW